MITGVGLVVDDFEELARDVLTRSGFREISDLELTGSPNFYPLTTS